MIHDAEKEFAKNRELAKEDVEALKQWVKRQPHLPPMSDLQIICFLQSCYYKLEATKLTIETFFAMKTSCPDFFANRNPNLERTKKSMDCGCFTKLPNVTPEGYNVLLFTFMQEESAKFNFADQVKIFDMNMRLWLEEDGTAQGLLILVDIEKMGFGHLAKFGVLTVRDLLFYLQEALPVRLKGLHFINAGSIIDRLMLLMKPFLKKELKEMLYIHKDVSESVFKFLPQKCFPEDYGGEAAPLTAMHDEMKQKLLANAEYFLQDENQLADESKRDGKRGNSKLEEYGMQGSFKKLEID